MYTVSMWSAICFNRLYAKQSVSLDPGTCDNKASLIHCLILAYNTFMFRVKFQLLNKGALDLCCGSKDPMVDIPHSLSVPTPLHVDYLHFILFCGILSQICNFWLQFHDSTSELVHCLPTAFQRARLMKDTRYN